MLQLTNRAARRFLLLRQGLLGPWRFAGKKGALAYVRQAGCIQFDPVDVCGKNAELTLQSRVRGFRKDMLWQLLYRDRALVDYPDKMLAILPAEDWPCFAFYRERARVNGLRFEGMAELERQALAHIAAHGPMSSDTLPLEGAVHWHSVIHWSGSWNGQTNAARAALEQLYSTGELVIHHKEGARKFYDLAARQLPAELLAAPDPYPDEWERTKWRVLRRVGAVGLLWDRPSGAWLGIDGLGAEARHAALRQLAEEGKLLELQVEGSRAAFFCRAQDAPLLARAMGEERFTPRCALLAPLDCMLWDRALLRTLFGFDYSWEIYTPAAKRKYGYYVLPLLWGERFAGRAELAADGKAGVLTLKRVWFEPDMRRTKAFDAAFGRCLARFAKFCECGALAGAEEFL